MLRTGSVTSSREPSDVRPKIETSATELRRGAPADRIRASARELFYRDGIRAVGVDQIVENAGVTNPVCTAVSSPRMNWPPPTCATTTVLLGALEAPAADHPGDPRGQLLAYLDKLAGRAGMDGYRGCGLSNAAVEYPDRDNPARKVAEDHKQRLRERLLQMCIAMGARQSAHSPMACCC